MDALASSADSGPVVTTIAARHKNLFDLLRLVAATMVLWSHAYALTGNPSPGWFGNALGTLGVKIFFIISGLMITRSWLDDPRLWAFTMRRVLRIMPGLILVVVVCAFVMGPLVTTLPVGEYFRSYGTRFYLWNILLFPIYNLPGVFAGNIYPIAVNGSLWSLPAEVCMYILTPLVLGRQPAMARAGIVIVAALFTACGLYCVRVRPAPPGAGILRHQPGFSAGCRRLFPDRRNLRGFRVGPHGPPALLIAAPAGLRRVCAARWKNQ